jgi:hypothetical protein
MQLAALHGGPIDPSAMGAGGMVGQPQAMQVGMMYGAGPHMVGAASQAENTVNPQRFLRKK